MIPGPIEILYTLHLDFATFAFSPTLSCPFSIFFLNHLKVYGRYHDPLLKFFNIDFLRTRTFSYNQSTMTKFRKLKVNTLLSIIQSLFKFHQLYQLHPL